MSTYTPVTNFGAKDALISGNPLKLIKGADFTTEFTAVQTAINSKFDGSVQFAPDGTAGQPSFGFSNNVGTGMYNTAGVLSWATAATQRGLISAAGNFTFNAPTSGTTLAVNGFSGTTAVSVSPGNVSDYGFNVAASATGNSAYQMQQNGVTGGSLGLAGTAGQLITGSQQSDLCIRAIAGAIRFAASGNSSTQASLDASGNFNVSNGVGLSPVYSGVPQNLQNSSYPFVLGDANKHIYKSASTAVTYTLPTNASVPFPAGTAITIVNLGTGAITLTAAIGPGNMYWLPSGSTTASRSIAQNGQATLLKVAVDTWTLTGVGIS